VRVEVVGEGKRVGLGDWGGVWGVDGGGVKGGGGWGRGG